MNCNFLNVAVGVHLTEASFRFSFSAREDIIRYYGTPAAVSLWPSQDEESDCRSLAVSPSRCPDPLSVFTPFWARPVYGETLPAPVTINHAAYYPAPSDDDDSDYWVYEDEDDHSFVDDREIHPLRKALTRAAAFFRKIFS
ncbi:uncharacterized protein LOC125376035 isoform X1 [Haliotis rufescens]|uniref:uncharacterized protein LOC125376035 isoform X1 n=1 Tax=Haliotis rufescens TaxID=6454 RepID=UPI00201EC37B|nr:uncharacterized protein LOC125376035 isoform X1 [Haliotis rufescens]